MATLETARITAYRTAFCSSRMLPGHEWEVSTCSASGAMPRTPLPSFSFDSRMKWLTSQGMSSRRSRSGDMWIVKPFRRYSRSSRNRPAATISSSRWFVAAIRSSRESAADSISMDVRVVRDQEVAGSNPVSPIEEVLKRQGVAEKNRRKIAR